MWENTCQLATTSSCPDGCKGPEDAKNVGSIDVNARCGGFSAEWGAGCMIKLSIYMER